MQNSEYTEGRSGCQGGAAGAELRGCEAADRIVRLCRCFERAQSCVVSCALPDFRKNGGQVMPQREDAFGQI